MMLIARISTAVARKAKKPIGVMAVSPMTTMTQPSHFGSSPWRTIDSPVPMRNTKSPTAIGRKSFCHRAPRAWTATGSMSSAASASAKLIVPSMARPIAMHTVPAKETSDSVPCSPSARFSSRRSTPPKKIRSAAQMPSIAAPNMIESLSSL